MIIAVVSLGISETSSQGGGALGFIFLYILGRFGKLPFGFFFFIYIFFY